MVVVLLLLALPLNAGITALSITYDRGSQITALNKGAAVLGGTIAFTADASWTITTTGCEYFGTGLVTFSATSGGTGPQSVRVMPNLLTQQTTIAGGANSGTSSCTIQVDGNNLQIDYTVFRTPTMFVTDFDGRFDSAWDAGCGTSNSLHGYKNLCDLTSAYAPQNGVALPAVGATRTDPLFGGKGLRLIAGYGAPYGSVRFNRAGDKAITSGGIVDTATASVIAALPAGSICSGYSLMAWDYRANGVADGGWCYQSSTPITIKQWHISGGAVVDDGTVFTHTHNLADHGATGAWINAEGWTVFPDSNSKHCLIHLPTGAATLACGDIDDTVRHVQISPRHDVDGCLYSYYGSETPGDIRVFKLCSGTLTKLPRFTRPDAGWTTVSGGGNGFTDVGGYGCVIASGCWGYGHSSPAWAGGVTAVFSNNFTYQANAYIYGWPGCTLSNGLDACHMRELGGGGWAFAAGHGSEYVDGAVGAPIVSMVSYGDDNRGRALSACTEAAGTVTCTVGGANPWVGSDVVLINGTSFPSGWNGYKTLVTSVGSTITFAGTGAGSGLSGGGILAVAWTGGARMSLGACRIDNRHCRLIAKHHGTDASTGDTFLTSPATQVSFRGDQVLMTDALGYPGGASVLRYYTGFEGCTERTKPNEFCGGGGLTVKYVTDTTALVTVTTGRPDASCTLEWSALNDYSTKTVPSLSGTYVRTHTITGLTASGTYRAHVWCDGMWRGTPKPNWDFAEQIWQQPTAAPSGSVALAVMTPPAPVGSASVSVDYGTTASMGTTTGISCTVGQRCPLTLFVSRGTTLYWQYRWVDGGSARIKTSAMNFMPLR